MKNPETTKMSFVYKKEKEPLKENEINVIEKSAKLRGGLESVGAVMKQFDTEERLETQNTRALPKTTSTGFRKQRRKKGMRDEEVAYYAQQIAEKLGDTKSISFYKQGVLRHNPQTLLEKAHEIMADGGAKNPGAVFVDWLKKQSAKQA